MIKVNQLSYRYPRSHHQTLTELNFTVPKGEIFGFLGPSGAGKSTIQKILIGLIKDYQGSATVNGYEIRETTSDFYEQIGVAFEFPNFYSKFTAMENLKLFSKFYNRKGQEPLELLKHVGLENAAHLKASSLSKGMKMRLNFVRALLHDPAILFLDEPTSGIDPTNARTMIDYILDLKQQGKTIIITTHNMHIAEEICDRVAFIVEGKVKLIDSPHKLMRERSKQTLHLTYHKESGGMSSLTLPITNLASNQQFMKVLKSNQLISMYTEEATLEDIFIEVTGRELT
ncbi:ABC transporter ATP-binding protein [Pseudalkalibacillus hwajinpoensis]|uniref:ABC transporter ATP-binding protein n=1 Tax=Guptibacillus hwajinpoensis TaxID=208199 RepID=UPI001CFF49D6|nr:ABC transporter ATP-binding protein [Pseudalkalibacillus hwajinpoensis]